MDLIEQTKARKRLRRMLADGSARAIRERAGVSQEALAIELGRQRHAVFRWEGGQGEPRAIADVVRWLELLEELAALTDNDDRGALATATA
jgi:DNA-binding transcriptional regulator YiaG